MACLQQVFIFLRYSKRSIYSPNKFLQLARPSWFEAGRQQDCSEFLTHLLDTLQEEEKSCSPRQAPATESETTEPVASTEVNDKPAEVSEGETNGAQIRTFTFFSRLVTQRFGHHSHTHPFTRTVAAPGAVLLRQRVQLEHVGFRLV